MSAAEIDEHISKRYDIKRRLGKGAYGIVWKAIDRRNNEIVAVKKIYDAFRNQTDAQRTFREIMFLQEFGNHPNVVKLRSIHRAVNNNDIYLVFEYMDADLHSVIRRGTILKDIHKRFIMYQLLKATKYIHSGNVIHRDQKPSNILLNSDCICKIADFGLARSVAQLGSTCNGSGEQIADPALTDYVATRWYRAPEILIGSKWYTQGIDMWSLGCILAEMFLGKPLFQGTSTINQIELIMATIPPPTPEDIRSICSSYGSSLLQKRPVVPRHSLEDMLHNAPLDGIDLVYKLLVFNPYKRLTAAQALQHIYVQRFHCEASEPVLSHVVMPPLRDDVQLSVDEYRNKLYELMSVGTKAHIKHIRVNHGNRAQKFSEQGQIRHIYQPSTWIHGVHDNHSKKGRHVSAELLTVHSVPAHCTVSVPISHLVPAQSDVNLHGHVAVPVTQGKKSKLLTRGLHHQPVFLPYAADMVQQATGDSSSQQHVEQSKLLVRRMGFL
ncbi:extracellular signal-regulated kinase 2 isoform X2 [Zootermopsis nevadensis]|uniref:mitogen-activated protein kinase n=1 Tax=Zootermopsis nevadensis TaxID=136037 RepID=A0A067RR94_ZOONE|nr:extracellular signal-regulated kinase 2 isoform X2 [Zootermopsis nevadensis]KDR22274.1 Putative serine/threonine-protein kinase C05D10.2 [Zootermopsis nevadensis]